MSKKIFKPKIITANSLIAGEAVYLTSNDSFTLNHLEANVFFDIDLASESLHAAKSRVSEIVDPYFVDVEVIEGKPVPIELRETFRSSGPTNYQHSSDKGIV